MNCNFLSVQYEVKNYFNSTLSFTAYQDRGLKDIDLYKFLNILYIYVCMYVCMYIIVCML